MNRSHKMMIITAFILMVVGFAAVATTLTINGTVKFTANTDNFEDSVVFTSATTDKGTATIERNGKSISYTTSALTTLNETGILNYTITNYSTLYDVEATINCAYTDASNTYNNYVTHTLDKSSYNIEATKSISGTLTVKLVNVTTDPHQVGIKCTIVANAIERGTLGSFDTELPDNNALSGQLLDSSNNPVANAVLAVFSEKKIVTSEADGIITVNNLEEGTHRIYLMNGYTTTQIAEMTKSNIESNATAYGTYTTKSTAGLINLTNASETVNYSIKLYKGTVNVVANNAEADADGEAHSFTAVASSTEGAVIKYGETAGTYDLTTVPSKTEKGTYILYYEVTAPDYKAVRGSITLTINEAALTCVKATSLHQGYCSGSVDVLCSYNGYYAPYEDYDSNTYEYIGSESQDPKIVYYGNLDGTFNLGRAYDCDVNGDGIYDSTNERFYYVSDLWNKPINGIDNYDNNYAVLVYYKPYKNGYNSTYIAANETNNNNGPTGAIISLPTTSEWKKVKLKSSTRQIYNELGTTVTSAGTLPSFSYEGYAARLLTYQELENAYPFIGQEETIPKEYNFLFENLKYTNYEQNPTCYLETPVSNENWNIWQLAHGGGGNSGLSSNWSLDYSAVIPVIEVEKSKIEQ